MLQMRKSNGAQKRLYTVIMRRKDSDLAKRVSYKYLDHAVRNGGHALLLGAHEYQVIDKEDKHVLAEGAREGQTVSFGWNRNGRQLLKAAAPKLWWPGFLRKSKGE